MGANKPDINYLELVLHGDHQAIRVALDVEYDTVVAKNASCSVRGFDVLRAFPSALMIGRLGMTSLASEKEFSMRRLGWLDKSRREQG